MRNYRGLRVDTGGWLYGDLIRDGQRRYIRPSAKECVFPLYRGIDLAEVHPESVGMYLGEVANGPLYEKDIIDMPFTWYVSSGSDREISDEGFFRGEVTLYLSCGIRIKKPFIHSIENGISKYGTHLGVSKYITKVIGNKTQNPELLKD